MGCPNPYISCGCHIRKYRPLSLDPGPGTGTCMVLRSIGLGASLLDESPLYTQTASWWVRFDSRSWSQCALYSKSVSTLANAMGGDTGDPSAARGLAHVEIVLLSRDKLLCSYT